MKDEKQAAGGSRDGEQGLFPYSADDELSDNHSDLIPSAPLEIDVKCGVEGLEKNSDCCLGDGLPGQARSNWVKVNQSDLVGVRTESHPTSQKFVTY